MTAEATWLEANQAGLSRELARVGALVAAHVGTGDPDAGARLVDSVAPDEVDAQTGSAPALELLVELFGLSAFERDVLLLCAGVEMEAAFGRLVGTALGDAARRAPTFGLALAALPGGHWSAVTPAGPLRTWRLVELGGPGVTEAPLRIDERILHFLTGLNDLDDRLHGLVEVDTPEVPGDDSAATSPAGRVGAALDEGPRAAVQVVGSDREARRAVALTVAAERGLATLHLDGRGIPGGAVERHALGVLVSREALLGRTAIMVDVPVDGDEASIGAFVTSLATPVIVLAAEPLPSLAGIAPAFEVRRPSRAEVVGLWRDALGEAVAGRLNGAVEEMTAQFDLGASAVRSIATRAQALSDLPDGDLAAGLWEACRVVARRRLDGLAQRIDAVAGWDDIVLPESQVASLRTIAAQVRHRHRVYEDWGFAEKSARGLGISALFAGPSGTGKTMAAEVLARELRLDLYRIDLAGVVSKYIGETEKNLRRLFDAAEGSGAVLLFDEADALFGKRSEVKDSHDRYANIEVSYLLQRMEAYQGLAILTTNQRTALDPAFLRRIRFVVQFPFPDAELRARIWRGVFPTATPTAGLDVDRLAQLNVAGGHIRNIALAGAFLAADRSEDVTMRHLADAARAEYAKLERTLSDGEIRGWA